MKAKLLGIIIVIFCLLTFACTKGRDNVADLEAFAYSSIAYLEKTDDVYFNAEEENVQFFSEEKDLLLDYQLGKQLSKEIKYMYIMDQQLFIVTDGWLDDEKGYVIFNPPINLDGMYHLKRISPNIWEYTTYPDW